MYMSNFGGREEGSVIPCVPERQLYIGKQWKWEWPLPAWPLLVHRPIVPLASYQISA